MLLFLRKIVFYFLVVLYLILTPYTILYALGYIFNPTQVGLLKTGLISITSFPAGATVFVHQKKFSERTPTAVRDLLPGRYRIRLFAKGYEPWEKEVSVASERATRLEPVLLLSRKPEEEVISLHSFQNFMPGILDGKIYAWEDKHLRSLQKIDLFFKKEIPVGRSLTRDDSAKMTGLYYRPKSTLALLEIEEKGDRGFWILGLGREKKMAQGLSQHLRPEKGRVRWDPKDPDQIYFLQDGNVSSMDIRRGALYPNIATEVMGFGVRRRHLLILKKDFTFVRTDSRGEDPRDFLEVQNAEELKKILSPRGSDFYDIEMLAPDSYLFLSAEGVLAASEPLYLITNEKVLGTVRLETTEEEKALFWSRRQLGVLRLVQEEESFLNLGEGPNPEEKKLRVEWLTRSAREIRQAFWAYEGSHIVFLDEDTVYLLEASGPAPYLLRMMTQVRPESSILYVDRSHSLFYLHPESGRLLERKLPR